MEFGHNNNCFGPSETRHSQPKWPIKGVNVLRIDSCVSVWTLCSFSLEMHVSVELVTGTLGWHYLFSALHRSVMGVLESWPVRSGRLCLGSLVEKVSGNMLWCLLWWKLKIINNICTLWVSDASTSKQNKAQSHSFRTIISLACMPRKLSGTTCYLFLVSTNLLSLLWLAVILQHFLLLVWRFIVCPANLFNSMS